MAKSIKLFLNQYLSEIINSISKADLLEIKKASDLILKTVKDKKTIFVCGNGGSAAIANHYICDYLKFLRQHSNLKPKVISLSSNIETVTAISNDIGYDQIFKYQAESLFIKNDLLIAISSSGESKNIKEVVKFSKKKKVKVIGFSAFEGGFLKKNSDISIYVPIKNYGVAEDSHHILMHIILQYLMLTQKNKAI